MFRENAKYCIFTFNKIILYTVIFLPKNGKKNKITS